MRRLRFFWVSGITSELLCVLSTTPWQWLCVTADIMWFLLSPGPEADDGDFWVLLCSPATAVTEKKKWLSMMIGGIFHTAWRSFSLCPCCLGFAERQIRSLCSIPARVCLSLGTVATDPHCHFHPKANALFLFLILTCFTVLSRVNSRLHEGDT